MKRREFLIGGAMSSALVKPQNTLEVEVMEIFSSSSGPSALLVHHADEATRETFSTWLRNNSGRQIGFQHRGKTPAVARIFRVSLCFGRGLILVNTPTAEIRPKDVLSVHLR